MLSILCVTRAEPNVLPLLRRLANDALALRAEFVLCVDTQDNLSALSRLQDIPVHTTVKSRGFIESVLDACVQECTRPYILRVDDDEALSVSMRKWLATEGYTEHEHWKFSRAHLWMNSQHMLVLPHLWPDHQTRLSTKYKSTGRTSIHCGSPYGGGELAPVVLEHWKFLVRSYTERCEIVKRYDVVQPGAGTAFKPFQVPEDVWNIDEFPSVPYDSARLLCEQPALTRDGSST